MTSSRNRRLELSGDYLTVLKLVWSLREARIADLCGRLCPTCTSQTQLRRIVNRLLEVHALTAKRAEVLGAAGRPPYCYVCGPRAAAVLSAEYGLPLELVTRRIRQDGRLSELAFAHRCLVADIQLALTSSAQAHGYTIATWLSEEQFRARNEFVSLTRKDGATRKRFITPDAFCVIQAGNRIAPLMIEAQLRSKPTHYLKKLEIYNQYISSGIFTNNFGYKSIRILGITDTNKRALNLQRAVNRLANASRYWSAGIDDIRVDALGARVWFVGGAEERMSLV